MSPFSFSWYNEDGDDMITSVSNEKIKHLLNLQKRKFRDEFNEFIIEGLHLVEEAIKQGIVKTIYSNLSSYESFDNVEMVNDIVMNKISEVMEPQGVIAICSKPVVSHIGERLLMLDHIQDPGNFGTLLRSALAFGFETVIYENSVDPYNAKVIRSTQGALFQLNLIESDLLQFIDENPEYIYYGTSLKDAFSLTTVPRKDAKIAIILGNEGAGVRQELLNKTSLNIFIDIDTVESLNVAVAGSIIMYHLRRLQP